MAYIWQEYDKNSRFVVSFEGMSPYMEVWDLYNKKNISVNPFYRIGDMLFPFEDAEKITDLADKYKNYGSYADIVNLIIHEIAQVDRIKGIDILFFCSCIEKKLILSGKYGNECAEIFESVSENKQNIILRYLAKYDMSNQRENVFDSSLNALFKGVKMYFENSTGIVHIFINERKTEENLKTYSLASLLFKDINVNDEVTWCDHFGIIGFDEVMIQDSIQII